MPSVLVIDDDLDTQHLCRHVLGGGGFDVVVARTGVDGLALARAYRADLVLATLQLPDLTALQILRELRQGGGGVPFVILTTTPMAASWPDATGYLSKPLAPTELLALARLHAGGTATPPGGGSRQHARAMLAMHLIDMRYRDEALTVGAVAATLGISTEHLCRSLKRQTGDTFVTLLRRARVRAACELLVSTTLSVKQIADRVGVGSTNRLDRDFKKLRGVSPTKYRFANVTVATRQGQS